MITILTPTYNREKTLTKAYESLLKQTNKDFEWLVVDDGSIDNTKKFSDFTNKVIEVDISSIDKENIEFENVMEKVKR